MIKDTAKQILRERLRAQQQKESTEKKDFAIPGDVSCTYTEVIETFSMRDREDNGMNTQSFKNKFWESNKFNHKIHFDKNTEKFNIIHIYT